VKLHPSWTSPPIGASSIVVEALAVEGAEVRDDVIARDVEAPGVEEWRGVYASA
jgi:hypothetical protein